MSATFEGFIRQGTGKRKLETGLLGVYGDIVSFSGSGDNVVIPAQAGRKIRIHKLVFIVSGVTNIVMYSNPAASAHPLSGTLSFSQNQGLAFDGDDFEMKTQSGESFVINSSNAVTVGGWIKYSVE